MKLIVTQIEGLKKALKFQVQDSDQKLAVIKSSGFDCSPYSYSETVENNNIFILTLFL